MAETAVPESAQKKYRLESRFRNINILFFLLMAAVMVLVVTLVIRSITESASRDYARFYSMEAVSKFTAYLNLELGLVAQIANSRTLIYWFAEEASQERKIAAYHEMMRYAEKLHSAELYFGINASLNEYSVSKNAPLADFKPFDVLSPTKEYDQWYFTCVNAKQAYTLHIDIDKVTTQKRLWINHKVSHDDTVLGVFCSGLQFSQVTEELFGKYDSASVRGIVVNARGVIQMDSLLVSRDGLPHNEEKRRIQEISADPAFTAAMDAYFQDSGEYFSSQDTPQVIKLEAGPYSFASLAPIAGTNWTVVTLFNSQSLFSAAKLLPLLYAIFIVLIVYIIAITVLNKKLIFVPFGRLIDSLNKAGADTNETIFGSDLNNEFGEIAQTIQNMRERLSSAVQAAEKANKAKSEFLSNMSHEIRTPMNAILGITEIQLQKETLAPDMYEALSRIYTSSDLLLGIINDILDMSKIEAGRLELESAEYDIASLINDAVQLHMMWIGSKDIEFELHVDENMPAMVVGDVLRVKQILNNLLSNALKYTTQGVINLSVFHEKRGEDGLAPGEAPDVTLVFLVSDTGQGMTADQVGRLFEAYARFNLKANRTIEGTGLGMSITHNLVRLMGGEISVASEPNRGTTFTVRLPQGNAGSGPLGRELADNLRQFRMQSTAHMKRVHILREPMPYGSVLVVDDMETNIYVTTGLLAPYGLTVDSAGSGRAAVEKIKQGRVYDIVFMDHMMPEMDGMEATRILRELGYTKPVVALTANAVMGQAEKFLANGFDDFLSKPIDLREMNAVLNKHVRDRHPPEVVEAAHRQHGDTQASAAAPQASAGSKLAKIFIRDASKAIAALEAFCAKRGVYSDEDMRSYVISVHGIKGSLAGIGKAELAELAAGLEQAGREGNAAVMAARTPVLLNALREVAATITPAEEGEAGGTTDEDRAYLRERLLALQAACAAYNKKAARDALAGIEQKTWPSPTREGLDAIAEDLLHSKFKQVIRAVDEMLMRIA